MPVFRYAEGSEPKDERVPEDTKKTQEARKERKDKNQPAPAEIGNNTYEEGENDGGGDSSLTDASSGARVSGGPYRS
jgi:hypothetical protein